MKKIPKNIKIETKRLILKPVWNNVDPKEMQLLGNNFTIANFVGNFFPFPYTIKSANEFLKKTKEDWITGKEFSFGIFIKKSESKKEEYIGNIGIKYDEQNKIISNLGYWIGEKYWDNGYATEIVREICKFCFTYFEARKIEASVYSKNIASQKVLEKCGFKIEGIRKKRNILKDKKIHDNILFGKFKK